MFKLFQLLTIFLLSVGLFPDTMLKKTTVADLLCWSYTIRLLRHTMLHYAMLCYIELKL